MSSLQSKLLKLFAKSIKVNAIWTKQGPELEKYIQKKQNDIGLPSKNMYKKYDIEMN